MLSDNIRLSFRIAYSLVEVNKESAVTRVQVILVVQIVHQSQIKTNLHFKRISFCTYHLPSTLVHLIAIHSCSFVATFYYYMAVFFILSMCVCLILFCTVCRSFSISFLAVLKFVDCQREFEFHLLYVCLFHRALQSSGCI